MSAIKEEQSSDPVKIYDSISEHTVHNKERIDMKDAGSVKLLTMAGLFDSYKCSKTNGIVYAYMVITVAAHEDYQFIHDRMPAILDGDEIIQWLDYEKYPAEQIASLLRPTRRILCHRVSMCVNKTTENSVKCVLAIDPNAIEEESPTKKMTPLKNVKESLNIKKQSRTPNKSTSKMKTPKDEKAANQPVKRNILQAWLETANDKKKPKLELEETPKANEMK
ncbi:hypothetical protein HELRODRAFT_162131 [Helobdella robusta]|uniref:Abasic site processing protein HMCES n=1 Tax=Helobdella robusta TaxID=6412 RepID=T1ES97_HELRO|nr:hypothetical protein HELRODRAFT_162131 [Helobdella robusta]ESN98679.1 hypothetical protein HELRODRAFT_162131 [Helobdella robusta]